MLLSKTKFIATLVTIKCKKTRYDKRLQKELTIIIGRAKIHNK